MEDKGAFKVLDEHEILKLSEQPHLFTQYNWVFNPNSESTPFRVITNTSAINCGTTISIEQLTPQKILNPMLNSLVRFSMYAVPLCADVASAYHCLLVDNQTALLRLFFWFHDVEGRLERGKVYQQTTQAFGDTAAAFCLEVAILKYIVAYAVLSVSKYILEYIRYSDNILYSFETQEEYRKVKKDLEESFAKFSLPLKYLISSTEYEPKMMEDPKRGPSRIEKTMGLLWDVIDDTITALPRYNLHGSSRGKATGPDLVEGRRNNEYVHHSNDIFEAISPNIFEVGQFTTGSLNKSNQDISLTLL